MNSEAVKGWGEELYPTKIFFTASLFNPVDDEGPRAAI